MDGNGRWAQDRGLDRFEGHRKGVNVVKPTIEFCIQNNIQVLSLFAFSSENWSRPILEVECIMDLFLQALERELPELHAQGICVRFCGDRSQLSSGLRQEMNKAESLTATNKTFFLNFALNYGGKWDIIQATKALADNVAKGLLSVDDIDEQLFAQSLSTNGLPDPDLFIRTSGEKRISNFFLWQLAYTELYFSDVNWPDFSTLEFQKALENYSQRKRRYGKLESESTHV